MQTVNTGIHDENVIYHIIIQHLVKVVTKFRKYCFTIRSSDAQIGNTLRQIR